MIVSVKRHDGSADHLRILADRGNPQLEMQLRAGVGAHDDALLLLLEPLQRDGHRVAADRNSVELKRSAVTRRLRLHPLGIHRLESDAGALDRPVLGIVDDALHRAKNRGAHRGYGEQQTENAATNRNFLIVISPRRSRQNQTRRLSMEGTWISRWLETFQTDALVS